MSEAILAAVILLPLLLAYFLKSNAALGFLALCAGYSVLSFAGHDIKNLLNTTNSSFVTSDTISLLLILVPTFVTFIICRGPSSRRFSNPKVFLNLLTALAAGAAFVIMAEPYFQHVGSVNLSDSAVWSFLETAKSEIIGIGALLALILIWLGNRKSHAKSKHHK